MNPWLLIIIGWTIAICTMSAVWIRQKLTSKSGIVDVVWSLTVGLLACFFCWQMDGLVQRRILVALLAVIWGARLASHIWLRLKNEVDDRRYLDLRYKWGHQYQSKLFKFYQFQAFGALLFAVPMLLAASNDNPLGWYDLVGILIWFVAIVGETIADRQLEKFKRNPDNDGQVCQSGLWRYSRHPNYFFEWLHWWCYVFFAIGAAWGWLAFVGPVAMLYFVLCVTGIPPAEASSLKSRGAAYRQYQKTTSAFFPWPPKAS